MRNWFRLCYIIQQECMKNMSSMQVGNATKYWIIKKKHWCSYSILIKPYCLGFRYVSFFLFFNISPGAVAVVKAEQCRWNNRNIPKSGFPHTTCWCGPERKGDYFKARVNTHRCEIIFSFRQLTSVKLEAFVFIFVFPATPGSRCL